MIQTSFVRLAWIATLVMGVSLGCPARGQLQTQHEDDLQRMGWSLFQNRDGVAVYNRQLAQSNVRELMLRAEIDAESARVLGAITDFDDWTNFMPNVSESKIIERSGQVEWVYLRLSTPFGKDRAFVSEVTVEEKFDGTKYHVIKWQLAKERTEKLNIEDTIAPRVNTGYWELRPTRDGTRTFVTYYLHADPAGKIPLWLINFGNRQVVPKVFKAVRQQAKLSQYDTNDSEG